MTATRRTVNLPVFTKEENSRQLIAARAAKKAKGELVKSVKTDTIENFRHIIDLVQKKDPTVRRIRVKRILKNIPGVGEKTALKILTQSGIEPNRTITSLGLNQQKTLLSHVNDIVARKHVRP